MDTNIIIGIVGVIVGVLGVLIALITFFINWRDKRPKLKVSISEKARLLGATPYSHSENYLMYSVTASNTGQKDIFIESVYIEFPDGLMYVSFGIQQQLPIRLASGQTHNLEFKTADIIAKLKERGITDKYDLSATVRDGLGNKYETPKVELNFKKAAILQSSLDKSMFGNE